MTVGTWTYRWAYDYRDRRVKEYQKVGAGAETQIKTFIWDGDDLIQERNGANTITRTHHFGGFADGTTGATKYETTTDHLGNVREVIAASGTTPAIGTVVARYEYTTFQGPMKVYAAAVGNVDASVLTIGRYYHKVLGAGLDLELALYRAYDPALGRWISEDPIGERGGLNLYEYVSNKPLNTTDPLGLESWGLPPQLANSCEKEFQGGYYDTARWAPAAFLAIPLVLAVEAWGPAMMAASFRGCNKIKHSTRGKCYLARDVPNTPIPGVEDFSQPGDMNGHKCYYFCRKSLVPIIKFTPGKCEKTITNHYN